MEQDEYLKEVQKDIKHIFAGGEGENVLEFLADISGHNNTIINPDSEMLTYVNEGRRQMYMVLLTFLNNKPEDLVKIYQEKFGE